MSVEDVTRLTYTVKDVGPAPELLVVEELQQRLAADPALEAAFEALTPGRQRE